MACGSCGGRNRAAQPRTFDGGRSTTQQFALVSRDGTTKTYGSRLEADAENARQGYTGIVKPVGS